MQDDQEFLDFELRDGLEQNTMLKLQLAKQLALLDQQSAENNEAKESLSGFIDGVRRSLAEGDIDVQMPR
jgi:hypothetical protein